MKLYDKECTVYPYCINYLLIEIFFSSLSVLADNAFLLNFNNFFLAISK